MEDRRCKLGLQGRLELVMLIENGSTLRAAAGRPERRAGDGASVVASLADGDRGRAGVAIVSAHQLDAAAVLSLGPERRGRAGDPGGAREDQLGTDAAAVLDRAPSLDDLEGAQASRRVAPASQRASSDHAPL